MLQKWPHNINLVEWWDGAVYMGYLGKIFILRIILVSSNGEDFCVPSAILRNMHAFNFFLNSF